MNNKCLRFPSMMQDVKNTHENEWHVKTVLFCMDIIKNNMLPLSQSVSNMLRLSREIMYLHTGHANSTHTVKKFKKSFGVAAGGPAVVQKPLIKFINFIISSIVIIDSKEIKIISGGQNFKRL